jgi:uncharacterized phiE125 gp8 family phage protein
MSLKTITPPSLEPVTVEDVKNMTRIDYSEDDSLLQMWIVSAREQAEAYMRRAFVSRVLELSFDTFPVLPIRLPMSPVSTVTSITYIDYQNQSTVMDLSEFVIDLDSDPARIDHAYLKTWPSVTLRPINSVKIRYTAGYGDSGEDVPAKIRDTILLCCSWKNANREAEKFPEELFGYLKPDRLYL